jgi:UDP-N-acetylglucosamine acyltransferase
VAHDCTVGSHTVFANSAALSGHVEVQDWAVLGGFAGVHQFCRVGVHAFMGGGTVATKDVLPFSMTVGDRARLYGLNLVGLRRRGLDADAIGALKQALRVLTQGRLTTSDAVAHLEAEGPHTPEVRIVLDFIRSAKRGVVLRPAAEREDEA